MKNNKGFSLVELIVVIAIMAILAAIAIPTFAHFITKANEASDAELLNNINYILNAACLENGVDISDITAAEWDMENMTVKNVKVNGDDNAKIVESFILHFGDMKNEKFINITSLIFDAGKHEFVDLATASEITLNYGDKGTITVTREQLEALKGSAFGEMEPEDLLGKVDYVSNLASSLLTEVDTDSSLYQMLNGDGAAAALAANLGIDISTAEGKTEFANTVRGMVNQKMDLLIAQGKYSADEDRSEGSALYNDAYNQIISNNAVLNAAQNSNNVSDNILTVLGADDSKSQIVDTVKDNSNNGLAQASMAYALYTAYAERNGLTVPSDPADVLVAIDNDAGFKAYIKNDNGKGEAQADLDGYLASMGMINNNVTSNEGAVSDILVNGFANDDLVGMLGQATGN
ncbi:MAG: prepilin-type N-terminal cleavage/methylation domain-containing protein [Clostridia bacterium]|nr:prepilin-type N-terminal cleavage/methylation domain-containing protein [Clostridia bacterium]